MSSTENSPAIEPHLHYQIWSQSAPGGPSYEFKVNCGIISDEIEVGFLWGVTRVVVTDPNKRKYDLAKDFMRNAYSGEVTRRWVLYGRPGEGLPVAGTYTYTFYKGDEVVHTHSIRYIVSVVAPPTGVTWRREGNDLLVTWQPPAQLSSDMTYKVIVFRSTGQVLSQAAKWTDVSARLADFPLEPGECVQMNVASFSSHGFAYTENMPIVW